MLGQTGAEEAGGVQKSLVASFKAVFVIEGFEIIQINVENGKGVLFCNEVF